MTDLLTAAPSLKKRRRAEARFRRYGQAAIIFSLGFLAFMLISIFSGGIGALKQTKFALNVDLTEAQIDPAGTREAKNIRRANFKPVILAALEKEFPEINDRASRKAAYKIFSTGAEYDLARTVSENPDMIGGSHTVWLTANSHIDRYVRGKIDMSTPESQRKISDAQAVFIDKINAKGLVERKFNSAFFTKGDSIEPEMSGMLGALIGTALSLIVCFALAFPIGIMTSVYLEEFSRKTKFTDFIEVNINNLAAVPSIVFGLLGLSIFLNVFQLPRSTPLVGGMVLALVTLPTIIIASRAALRAVPPSVRQAALGLGASRVQTTLHHTVPLAMPGMLTGAIIGMARALGETAPLLMIGMVAFIVDLPQGFTDAATALPVQIFLWADRPEQAFTERTQAAIMVLLTFLIIMNIAAILLRRRFERRW